MHHLSLRPEHLHSTVVFNQKQWQADTRLRQSAARTLALTICPNETTAMLEESTNSPNDTEIENIQVAAALLRQMLLELQDLEVNNARMHFAMSNSGQAIRQRLDMLSGIAELLKADREPLRACELNRRARALIRQLAGELEQLAQEAEHDFDWIT